MLSVLNVAVVLKAVVRCTWLWVAPSHALINDVSYTRLKDVLDRPTVARVLVTMLRLTPESFRRT